MTETGRLIRPLFHAGQLLSDRSLEALATWSTNKFRHAGQRHGYGIVRGLVPQLKEDDAEGRTDLVLSPGEAIDREGRSLVLEFPRRFPVDDLIHTLGLQPPSVDESLGPFDLWLIWVTVDDGEPLPRLVVSGGQQQSDPKKERVEDVGLELRKTDSFDEWRKTEDKTFREFEATFEAASSRDERRRLLREALAAAFGAPPGVPLGRIWLQGDEKHGQRRTVVAVLSLGDVRAEVRPNEELFVPAGSVNSALLLDRSPVAARRWLAARGIDVRRIRKGEGEPWTVGLSPGDAVELHVQEIPGLGEVVEGVEPCSTIADELGELWKYVRILVGWLMLLGFLTMVILLAALALIGNVFGFGWFLAFLVVAILSLIAAWLALERPGAKRPDQGAQP